MSKKKALTLAESAEILGAEQPREMGLIESVHSFVRRGRPRGEAVSQRSIMLSDADVEIALKLGDGMNVSEGVRRALRMASKQIDDTR